MGGGGLTTTERTLGWGGRGDDGGVGCWGGLLWRGWCASVGGDGEDGCDGVGGCGGCSGGAVVVVVMVMRMAAGGDDNEGVDDMIMTYDDRWCYGDDMVKQLLTRLHTPKGGGGRNGGVWRSVHSPVTIALVNTQNSERSYSYLDKPQCHFFPRQDSVHKTSKTLPQPAHCIVGPSSSRISSSFSVLLWPRSLENLALAAAHSAAAALSEYIKLHNIADSWHTLKRLGSVSRSLLDIVISSSRNSRGGDCTKCVPRRRGIS
ncbi:hypothetical protein Tco_0920780 [Tanacetum coccineum]